jgi:hypothetical protein
VFPDGLSVVPYTDAAGVACYALNEILLQSHGELIRILPATADDWSGLFQLRAEGGFLVGVSFRSGEAQFVEVRSLLGNSCRIANPWDSPCVVRHKGTMVLEAESNTLAFDTSPGETFLITPQDAAIQSWKPTPLRDIRHDGPGMPGRDS